MWGQTLKGLEMTLWNYVWHIADNLDFQYGWMKLMCNQNERKITLTLPEYVRKCARKRQMQVVRVSHWRSMNVKRDIIINK